MPSGFEILANVNLTLQKSAKDFYNFAKVRNFAKSGHTVGGPELLITDRLVFCMDDDYGLGNSYAFVEAQQALNFNHHRPAV